MRTTSVHTFYERVLDNVHREIEDIRNQLEEDVELTTRRNLMRQLTIAKRNLSLMLEPDKTVWRMLKDKFERITFLDDTMIVRTKHVSVKYYIEPQAEHICVPLGTFTVICDFKKRTTVFEPDVDNAAHEHLCHPHISNGSPCWGSYSDAVARSYRTYNVCELLTILLDYLTTCYKDGWYGSILHFTSQYDYLCDRCELEDCECENYCAECGEHDDNCSCNYCGECGSHMDDCSCVRCPETADILYDGQFPDNDCATCTQLMRDDYHEIWYCNINTNLECNIDDYTPPISTAGRHRYRTITERTTV